MDSDNPFQAAQTIDPEVRAYVYSLVTALGGTSADEGGLYVLGDDSIACLRDLKRWLKLYDEKTNRLDVARCLAEANLVNGDLLPILALWPEEASNDRVKARLALACLELLVPLTWPLETGSEMTVNHHRHIPYIQQAHVIYKAGVLSHDTSRLLRTVVRVGLPSIAMSREDRTARDEGIIKLMLYFFRNITVITPAPNLTSQGLENEVSRSATIEAFRQQDVFALLLTMCSNMGDDFDLQDVIILEILFNIVKGVDAEKLWMTNKQKVARQTNELKDVIVKEKGMHRGYAKMAPTRHGRFGTMIWQKGEDEKMWAVSGQENLVDARSTMLNIDRSKKWNKPQQRRKDIDHSIHDFDRSVHLTPSACELLRNFVEEFLDSGFNPLFIHLRKAIEREAERILDVNYRQFFYAVSWFLQSERARRERQKKDQQKGKLQTDFEAESYGLVAGALNQEAFVTLNRFMQTSYDNKEWQDLNASMRCFTQILLTVQEMAQSPLEEDQEIADNIQNRIFYEETTHDRIVSVLRGYKDQGFGYLDACTELSHVFLRMLERYSKENADLQIRSRRRARRKRKQEREKSSVDGGEEEDDEQSENEDLAQAAQVSRERKFDFNRFAAKFTSQSSVDSFVVFTSFYRDLSVEQLKRAHRFFYRVAFRQDLAVLLYRVDIIALFYKMIKGPEALDVSHEMYKEWNELVRQILKKLFKKLEQRPELVVEMLFSKINATLYYLEYGREKQTTTSSRAPAELEVKPAPGRGVQEQIGIVIAALERDGKSPLIRWINATLKDAQKQRQGWEGEAEARKEIERKRASETETSEDSEERKLMDKSAPDIVVHPPDADVKSAMFKNARLKLLMGLVGFERVGDEDSLTATWIIPSALTSQGLEESLATVERYEQTPWVNEIGEESPEELLRRVRKTIRGEGDEDPPRDAFIDDSEGSDGLEDFMYPDNVRAKKPASNALDDLKQLHRKRKRKERNAESSEDEEGEAGEEAKRRKARIAAALERRRKIKSELYIRDSDEEMDEEARREFFAKEEEGRKRQDRRIAEAMRLGRTSTEEAGSSKGTERTSEMKRMRGGKSKKKRKNRGDIAFDEDEDEGMLSDGTVSSFRPQRHTSDGDDGEEDTPISSQVLGAGDDAGPQDKRGSLKEIQQPRAQSIVTKSAPLDTEEDDGGEDIPATTGTAVPRRRFRAGFIVDSDDDDDDDD